MKPILSALAMLALSFAAMADDSNPAKATKTAIEQFSGVWEIVAVQPPGSTREAQEVLTPYLLRQATRHCFSPAESERRRRRKATEERKTPHSCGNKVGSNRVIAPSVFAVDCYTAASYRRAVHRVCEKQGISPWSPNRLRHTAATEIRRRFGLEAAQVVCGHQRADVTQVYAERDLALAVQVAREVG